MLLSKTATDNVGKKLNDNRLTFNNSLFERRGFAKRPGSRFNFSDTNQQGASIIDFWSTPHTKLLPSTEKAVGI